MIAIIDYDAGNIKSVEKAFEYLSQETVTTRDPEILLKADKVVLPGVGSFGDAMNKLHEYNLVDVIEGNCRIKQALIKDKRHDTLYLLPSAQTKDKSAVSPEQMRKLAEQLKEEFDYIIMDCPAGIEQGFQNAIAGADSALVVTTPEVSAVRDADRIIGLLEANEMKQTHLIVNRLRTQMVKDNNMMSSDDVVEILGVDLIGVVPDDEQIIVATNNGEPLVGTDALAGQAYMNICRRLLGEEVPLLDLNSKHGIFSKIGSLFKKN